MKSLEFFEVILNTIHDAVLVIGSNHQILYSNKAAYELLGENLDNGFSIENIPIDQILQGKKLGETELLCYRKDGTARFISITASKANIQSDTTYAILAIEDITTKKTFEDALRESEERFRGAFDNASVGMALVTLDGSWLKVNQSLCRIIGYSEYELLSKTFQDITHPDDLETDLAYVNQLLSGELDSYRMEKRYLHKDGFYLWCLLSVSLVHDTKGKPIHFVSQIEDIAEFKRNQEKIQYMADHDTLTNLPNRRLLNDRLTQALSQAKRYQRAMAVMYLDIDHFKNINDTYGHNIGDKVLKAVATRLTDCMRDTDTISRQGGDEFVIVLPEISTAENAEVVASNILNMMHAPIAAGDHEIRTSVSIGIAIHEIDSNDSIEQLLHKADEALYSAKAAGRNQFKTLRTVSDNNA